METEPTDSAYQQAVRRMLDHQRERALEKFHAEQSVLAKAQEAIEKDTAVKRNRLHMNLRYQSELQEQIRKDQYRKEQVLQDKQTPGIAVELHGYPHRPQTPIDVRRRRELEKQAEFFRSVSEQQAERARLKREATEKEMKLVQDLIEQDNREKEKAMLAEYTRRKKEREELNRAWLEADKTKKMIHEIEKSVYTQSVAQLEELPKPAEQPEDPKAEKQPEATALELSPTLPTEAADLPTSPTPKKDAPKLTISQIQSLAQLLASSAVRLPVIRQYHASDVVYRSPEQRHKSAVRVTKTQKKHTSPMQVRAQHTLLRSTPAIRSHSLSIHRRSPIKAGAEGKTYITESMIY